MGARYLRPATGLLLVGCLCTATARADRLSLEEVLGRLAEDGHSVLYSSDVVRPGVVLDLPHISLSTFRRALSSMHLSLRRVGDHWVITPTDGATQGPTILRIRSTTGEPLRLVEARWRGRRYPIEANDDGDYPLALKPGTLVTVHAQGHRPALARVAVTTDVVLAPSSIVESIIVTGTRHRLTPQSVTGSITTLTAEDLSTVPSLGGDALRAAAQLPGMSSMGVSAKPRIRGGLQDEMLIRLDGVELLDSYHLADFQSIFSAIDDRAVAAVDVYTGGFPARYGNRMSGVMDVIPGPPEGEPQSEIGISLLSLLANVHGTSDDGAIEYVASARRGNLDQIIKQVDSDLGRPRYYDAFARVRRRLTPRASVWAGAFFSKDDVRLTEDETAARSNIDSRYLWVGVEVDDGADLSSTSTLAYTWSRRNKRLDDLDDDSGAGGFLNHELALDEVSARTDVRWRRGQLLMETGAEAEYGRGRYDSTAWVDRKTMGEVLSGSAIRSHDIQVSPEGWSGGVYWAAGFPLTGRLLLQPGIRWDFQSFDPNGTTYHLSPRLGMSFQATDLLTFRVDAGRFRQPQGLHELQVADGVATFSRPQSADHGILGVQWMPTAQWELHAEVYEKRYRRTSRRFENLFNPFVLVPELEPDRVAVDPRRARARGADLALRHHFSERASAALRYSYMDAEDRIGSEWVPRRWSQRHSANATVSWRGTRIMAAVSLTWHSGWWGAELPETVPSGTTLPVSSIMSNLELDDYVSLDVSLRRTWRVGRSRVTGFIGVTNLGDRDNVAGIEYDAEEDGGVVTFERQRETLVPLVPSAGVLVTF